MTASPNTILLKGKPRTFELPAGVAINPGYFLRPYNSSGNKFEPWNIAGAVKAPKLIALEQEYLGKGISVTASSYADATTVQYAIADTVIAATLSSGDEVYAKLAASATAITVGDFIELAADGTVRKATAASTDPTITDSTGGTASPTFAAITAPGSNATSSLSADMLAVKNALSQIALNLNDLATVANGQAGAFAWAMETVDNSGGSGEVFIRIQMF